MAAPPTELRDWRLEITLVKDLLTEPPKGFRFTASENRLLLEDSSEA